MSPISIGILGILVLFILLAMRMQIGFAMALVGFLGFIVLNSFESAIGVLGIDPIRTSASYTLSVIPLFLLMGQFAHHSGMGAEIYEMFYRWIGFFPGGLAMANKVYFGHARRLNSFDLLMKFAGFFHTGPVTILCQMTNTLICFRHFRITGIFSLHISVYEKAICMYHF